MLELIASMAKLNSMWDKPPTCQEWRNPSLVGHEPLSALICNTNTLNVFHKK